MGLIYLQQQFKKRKQGKVTSRILLLGEVTLTNDIDIFAAAFLETQTREVTQRIL